MRDLWRLEMTRLVRTHRLLGLGCLFLALGLCLPVLTANLETLLRHSGETDDLIALLGNPRPVDGLGSYLSQVSQLGIMVLIIMAAGPLCPYARRGSALYYWGLANRAGAGRWVGGRLLVLPRFVALAACSMGVFLLGLLGAWYETAILIGSLDPGRLLIGAGLYCLYLTWVIAVVAAVGAAAKGTVATSALSALVVVVVAIAESIPVVGKWQPSRLADAPVTLLDTGKVLDFLPAVGVTVVATAALLVTAVGVLDRREL
jgi:ABC-2 type transport system permease protein